MRLGTAAALTIALLLSVGAPARAATILFHFEGTVSSTEDTSVMEIGDTLSLDYFIDENHPNQEAGDRDRAFYGGEDGPIRADVFVNGIPLLEDLPGSGGSEGSTNFINVARGLGFVDEVLWRATDSGNENRVAASFDFPESTTPEFPDLDTISGLLPPLASSITVDLGRGGGERSFVAEPVSDYEASLVPEPAAALLVACALAWLAPGRARR